jgi:hypothetical protein
MSQDPASTENIFTERTLGAHRLAQYVSRNRCARYLRLALFPAEAKTLAARYRVGFETLSPLLSESGQTFEREQVTELAARATLHNLQNTSAHAFVVALKSQPAGSRSFYYQARLEGRIGGCSCEGYPDLVEIERHAGDRQDIVDVTVIDIKASRRETVGFRLQVAFYARLLQEALGEAGLEAATFKGAIAARGSELAPDKIERFDLSLYLDEIEQLVAAPDSDVARAAASTFTDAAYHLGAHCDGCPYNALCFIDTAEREDLSLVPTLTATEKSALGSVGVTTTRELFALMNYGKNAMLPAPGRADDFARIGARWPLGTRLPVLAQRARAALKALDASVEAKRYMLGADWGSLPDEAQYPNLIKVYVDAQRDHLEDKVYLLSALVAGAAGAREIVEHTPMKPDTESERALLVGWIARLLPAIAEVADATSAPVHVYLYDRRGQRSLLDALARHFEALCAIPAFYDLLTSTPALTQGMISFLAEEVGERLNLGAVCQNLYEVAREMNFQWRDGEREFLKTFRARIFDNKRLFKRDAATGGFVATAPEERASNTTRVESAARFGTEIPLEYVYAAWGLLTESPEMQERERTQIRGFMGVTLEDIRALAVERCRALRFIEESFQYKNRQVEKQSLSLARLDETELDTNAVALSRALEDFLYLEHHAKMQELLLHLSLPPAQRAAGGRTLIVRCNSYEKTERGEEHAGFSFATLDGELLTDANAADMAALRVREGDWVVLNPATDEATGKFLPARKLVRGRLAVVEELDDARIRLRLLPLSFKNSEFRYPHWSFKPEAGAVCTIDEMADDLNADKFLDACRHAASNHLYQWLADTEEGKRPRAVRPKRLRDATEIAALASRAQTPYGLTEAQTRVVGGYLTERVLVLQGPPGTGKSHTLGFAVLARALALATPARPFRVAVAAKTHAATAIALASIAKRARQLLASATDDPRLAPLARLRVAKISNDAGEALAEGVLRLSADGGDELSAVEQWAMLLEEPLLVVGGTPGGIYNLVRKGASKGRAIDWTQELFDLVVVDEASQMGIAEAMTAAAFLRGDGQFIAIGDHRQMPPILAHAWDQESRRDLKHARPHLSIFETLRAHGFQSEALDQSFRIPTEIAAFLQRHIYAEDGIDFRSDNRTRLRSDETLDGWLGAAFASEHSLVVIEHDECGSQQSNEFEASLVEELAGVACEKLGCNGEGGIGVVVPHRAQKALLRARLPQLAHSIDTVERFQGGERELIILSATVSDRAFAQLESGFLLEPRRLTVAISRPKRKLIVVASRAVFDLIPADLDEYERGALWKYLRHECSRTTLWEGEVRGQRVRVRTLCET